MLPAAPVEVSSAYQLPLCAFGKSFLKVAVPEPFHTQPVLPDSKPPLMRSWGAANATAGNRNTDNNNEDKNMRIYWGVAFLIGPNGLYTSVRAEKQMIVLVIDVNPRSGDSP